MPPIQEIHHNNHGLEFGHPQPLGQDFAVLARDGSVAMSRLRDPSGNGLASQRVGDATLDVIPNNKVQK